MSITSQWPTPPPGREAAHTAAARRRPRGQRLTAAPRRTPSRSPRPPIDQHTLAEVDAVDNSNVLTGLDADDELGRLRTEIARFHAEALDISMQLRRLHALPADTNATDAIERLQAEAARVNAEADAQGIPSHIPSGIP